MEKKKGETATWDCHQDDDPFYNVLKNRVRATLMEKGIDPIQDRGATVVRSTYYGVIFCLWVAAGFKHIMVRRFVKYPSSIFCREAI